MDQTHFTTGTLVLSFVNTFPPRWPLFPQSLLSLLLFLKSLFPRFSPTKAGQIPGI